MRKIMMEEILIKLVNLDQLPRRAEGVPVVVKTGGQVFADVVFKNALEYCRIAHRHSNNARSFGTIETAVRALNSSGFNDVIVKNLDITPLPEEVHFNDESVIEWQQKLDAMGHSAPVDELRQLLRDAPEGADKESLAVFLAGYDRAKREN